MSEDYQRRVERKLRRQTHVAVASTAPRETTYIWHTGDRYRAVTRTRMGGGYEWGARRTVGSYRRTRMFDEHRVAAVRLHDVPGPVAALVRAARDEDDDEKAVASLMADMSGMGSEDDVVAVYDAVEEYDGKRRKWEVGRILDEADVERLDAVVTQVDRGLDLDEEDCEECRAVFAEHDQPPGR